MLMAQVPKVVIAGRRSASTRFLLRFGRVIKERIVQAVREGMSKPKAMFRFHASQLPKLLRLMDFTGMEYTRICSIRDIARNSNPVH